MLVWGSAVPAVALRTLSAAPSSTSVPSLRRSVPVLTSRVKASGWAGTSWPPDPRRLNLSNLAVSGCFERLEAEIPTLGVEYAYRAPILVDLDQDAVNQPDTAVGALATFQPDEVLLVLPDQQAGSLKRDRESAARGCADGRPARVELIGDLDHGDKFPIDPDQRARCIEELELRCVDHGHARRQLDRRAARVMLDLDPLGNVHLARPLGNRARPVRFRRQARDQPRPFGDVDRSGSAGQYSPRGSG